MLTIIMNHYGKIKYTENRT